jgi:hypothetical protein
MAQAPSSNSPSKGGGSASRTNSKGAPASHSKSARGKSGSNKKDPLETLANVVPSHHAHHGMAGEYSTKGKWANMPDGNSAFEG